MKQIKRLTVLCVIAIAGAFAATAEVQVNMTDALKAAVNKPSPEYNPMAKKLNISGAVEVEVRIDENGDVSDVKVVKGNALLTGSVQQTVKKWKFTPFKENGAPAAAVTTLKFSFTL